MSVWIVSVNVSQCKRTALRHATVLLSKQNILQSDRHTDSLNYVKIFADATLNLVFWKVHWQFSEANRTYSAVQFTKKTVRKTENELTDFHFYGYSFLAYQ